MVVAGRSRAQHRQRLIDVLRAFVAGDSSTRRIGFFDEVVAISSELLEAGTPIHVVTRLMRHADSNVTLEHYAHILGDAERVASEKFSQRIGQQITQLESDSEMESASVGKTA